jgi:hypothetical protein
MALGLMHAVLLRDTLRGHAGDGAALAAAWDEATGRELAPWYESTVAADRTRIAQLQAARTGGPYTVPADPASRLRAALPLAMGADPDVFRGAIEILGCVTPPGEVFARPGFAEKVMAAAAARGDAPMPGPDREELLRLVGATGVAAATS